MARNDDLNIVIGGDIEGLIEALDDAQARSKNTSSGIVADFEQIAAAGAAVWAGASVIKEGVSSVAEMSDSLLQAKAAAGLTSDQLDILKEKALELGGQPAQTPLDVAAGFAVAQKAGYSFDETLSSIEANLQLAAGSELSLEEAIGSTAAAVGQFNLKASDTGEIVDTVIAGSNLAYVSSSQLFESFKKGASVSSNLGQNIQQTTAAIVAMAKQHVVGEQAGTALNGIWASLLDKSDQLSESYGVQVYEMVNGVQTVRSLADITGDLQQAQLGVSELFDIFGRETMPGVNAIMAAGKDGLLEYEAALNSAEGTGKRTSETLQSGLGGALRTIQSDIEVATLKIGDEFAPAVQLLADNSYLLGRTIDAVSGVVNKAASGLTAYFGVAIKGVEQLAKVSDAIGATDNLAGDIGTYAAAAFESALDLSIKADESFDSMLGKQHESVKVLGDYDSELKAAEESSKKLTDTELDRLDGTADKTASNSKALSEMYKTAGIAGTGYFEGEEKRILALADSYLKLGGDEKQIAAYTYQEITKLSKQAWAAQDSAMGRHFDQLASEYASSTDTASQHYQELIDNAYAWADSAEAAGADTVDVLEELEKKLGAIKGKAFDAGEFTISSDIGNQLADIKDQIDGINGVVKAVDSFDGTKATAILTADASGVEEAVDLARSALDGFTGGGGGTISVDMASVSALKAAINEFNETPTLDPFGEAREKYAKQIEEIREAESDAAEIIAAERKEHNAEVYAERKKTIAENKSDAIDAELEVAEARNDAMIEAREAELEAAKETLEARLESEKTFYEEKLAMAEEALESEDKLLSAYKKMASDTESLADSTYYQAESDALARQAQEWQDMGISVGRIKTWLVDELGDLADEAQEAGAGGLAAYNQSIIDGFESTGNFSDSTVEAQDEIEALKEKIEELNNTSADDLLAGQIESLEIFKDTIEATEDANRSAAEAMKESYEAAAEAAEKTFKSIAQYVKDLKESSSDTANEMAEGLSSGEYSFQTRSGSTAWGYATGGVMSSDGNVPLKKYATGGVAHSPQISLFGEGDKPEAYVPLEDGRTIPVTIDFKDVNSGKQDKTVINNNDNRSSVVINVTQPMTPSQIVNIGEQQKILNRRSVSLRG